MPIPAVAVGLGVLAIAFVLANKKKSSSVKAVEVKTGEEIEPIIWKPEPLPEDVIGYREPEVTPPPPADDGLIELPFYKIQGNARDAGPLLLAKEWTGEAAQSRMEQLSQYNKDLRRTEYVPVVFVPESTGVAVDSTRRSVELPSGQSETAYVTLATSEGGYPNRPAGQGAGAWRNAGARYASLTPWNVGQTVAIPADWGQPPASLAEFVTVTKLSEDELAALLKAPNKA